MATVSNLLVAYEKHSGYKSASASWTWTKSHTANYSCEWQFATGNKDKTGKTIWYEGSSSSSDVKNSLYTIPNEAISVRFRVKPIATKKTDKKKTPYWSASWSAWKKIAVVDCPAKVVPNFTIEIGHALLNLTVGSDCKSYKYQIFEDDSCIMTSSKISINLVDSIYIYHEFIPGRTYYARVATYGSTGATLGYGDLSSGSTSGPSFCEITDLRMNLGSDGTRSMYIAWDYLGTEVKNNNWSYDIEYTTTLEYIKDIKREATGQVSKITVTSSEGEPNQFYNIPFNIENEGAVYYFRVRANNGSSSGVKYSERWSEVMSCPFGVAPSTPTTWTIIDSYRTSDSITVYFNHNSLDGSPMRKYRIVYTNGDITNQIEGTVPVTSDNPNSGYYTFSSLFFTDGSEVRWKVQTMGAVEEWSPFSVERVFTVYDDPIISLTIDGQDFTDDDTGNEIKRYPVRFTTSALNSVAQTMISVSFEITANNRYRTTDTTGRDKYVNEGEVIYSKTYNVNNVRTFDIDLNVGDVILENGEEYTAKVTAAFNTGLSAYDDIEFMTSFENGVIPEPDTDEVVITRDLCAVFNVYCMTDEGAYVNDVLFSVYRIDFDGGLTPLYTDIEPAEGSNGVKVVDYHPSLNEASYRLVAKSKLTGEIVFNDIPAEPVGETGIVIQWDDVDNYISFEDIEESDDEFDAVGWSGTILKLPYNITTSETTKIDTGLIEYIGRDHPVSYYGTQLGQTANWRTEIPRNDMETINILRRLSVYRGDVYVREPTGTGYWAHVVVSFDRTYDSLKVPVSLSITRVEGGA